MPHVETSNFRDLQPISNKNEVIGSILEGKGVSPELLRYLNSDEIPTPETYEKLYLLWAVFFLFVFMAISVIASQSKSEYEVNGITKEIADLFFTPGNAPVLDAKYTTIIRQFGQWGISFLQQGTLIASFLAVVRLMTTQTNQIIKLIDQRTRLQERIESGRVPLPMPDGYTAINLGNTNDAIGNAIGNELGWVEHSLPLIEGPTNLSDSDLWVQLSNPCENFDKAELFNRLDSVRFNLAGWLILCPVKADQAFLPDMQSNDHFDWNLSETVREIELYDEYCRKRRISVKPMIVIADAHLSSSVTPYVQGRKRVKRVTETLKEKIESLNNSRAEWNRIVLVDPSEIVLAHLAELQKSLGGQPFEFYMDPDSKENYASRFISRCQKRQPPIIVKTNGDPSVPSIKVVYCENDIKTRHIASMVGSERTVVIVSDATQQMSSPYYSIIISELVKDFVINGILRPDKALHTS